MVKTESERGRVEMPELPYWRLIGPHRGGRVVAVAGDPVHPLTFYFGSTGGGVWKTTDAGLTWRNVSDGYFNSASVGAIAVAPSDPNVLYVGMGEATIRGNVSFGDGVYRSTDGGKSWTHRGLRDTRHIGKVRVHPQNPDLVYVAAFGHAFGPNEERGVYRSKDGGSSWEKILYRDEHSGAIDPSHRPEQSANSLCHVVAGPARRLLLLQWWSRLRVVPVERWRGELGGTDRAARAADRTPREDRGRPVAGQTGTGLGTGGSARGLRALSQRR